MYETEALNADCIRLAEGVSRPFTRIVDRPSGLEVAPPTLNIADELENVASAAEKLANPEVPTTEPYAHLKGEHILLHKHPIYMPHAIIELKDLLVASHHSFSACVVVPQGLSGLVKQHHPTARQTYTFKKGEVIGTRENPELTTGERAPSEPIKHPHHIYYIPTKQPHICTIKAAPELPKPLKGFTRSTKPSERAEAHDPSFMYSFAARVRKRCSGKVKCGVLGDSGCATGDKRFAGVMDKRLADLLELDMHVVPGATCNAFNGTSSQVYGSVTTSLMIGKCTTVPLTFLVVDCSSGNDIYLGQEGLCTLKSVMDFGEATLSLRNEWGVLHTIASNAAPTHTHSPKCSQISFGKAMKMATSTAFVCMVRTKQKGEEETEDPRITKLVNDNAPVFAPIPDGEAHWKPGDPGFRIRTVPGSVPPARAPHRAFGANRKIVQDELTKLIQSGKITPSNSPYGAPVLFVPKPDGTLRFCIDYRALNRQTIKDRHPLPRVNDMLDAMEGASIFSSVDLTCGFYQVPVAVG